MIKYEMLELLPNIDWTLFYKEWGFSPHFASIASVQGCDVMRANWLVDFKEEERADASNAMQLLKEVYRILPQLNDEYRIFVDMKTINELSSINKSAQGVMIATASAELDLLYENDEKKRKLVQSITMCFIEAAINKTLSERNKKIIELIETTTIEPLLLDIIKQTFELSTLELTWGKSLIPRYARVLLFKPMT